MSKTRLFEKAKRRFAGLLMLAALAGCSSAIPVDRNGLRYSYDGVITRLMVTGVSPEGTDSPYCGIKPLTGGKGDLLVRTRGTPLTSYRVGPGDDLRFNIFGEVGMSDVVARVDAEGYVQLPIVETLQVQGLTTREIQSVLKGQYEQEFVDPWVTVELAKAESHPVYFLGQFLKPGVRYLEFATDLIEALALAEGLNSAAYLPGARLIRDRHVCTVDLMSLLTYGDFSQNVWMEAGDVIYAPSKEDMRVYMLGAVGTHGSIAFGPDGKTVLQAISEAGGWVEGSAKLKEVRVIRTLSPTRGELILLDVHGMIAGRYLDFALQPGDVVYVPTSELGSWNAALREILPTLTVLSGVLTPITLIQALLNQEG